MNAKIRPNNFKKDSRNNSRHNSEKKDKNKIEKEIINANNYSIKNIENFESDQNDINNINHILNENSASDNLKIHLTLEQLILSYNKFEDNNNKKEIIGGIIQPLSTE